MLRRPIVRVGGENVQLPPGDSIDPGAVLLRVDSVVADTAGQTVFELEYPVGMIVVTLDGALLPPIDYAADDGEQIVLDDGDGVEIGSILTCIVFSPFDVADALPLGGTAANSHKLGGKDASVFVENPLTTEGDLIVGGSGGAPERLAGASAALQYLRRNAANNACEWGSPSPAVYDSGWLDMTVAVFVTLTHGLGAAPNEFRLILRAKAAEAGFSIGDELPIPLGLDHAGTAVGYGVQIQEVDGTTFKIGVGTTFRPAAASKTFSTLFSPTLASWQLKVIARRIT